MNTDKRSERTNSVKSKKKDSSISKATDHEINTSVKDFAEKIDNSIINKSFKDVKQTPDNSFQRSEGYRINFFDLIQNNLFPSSPLNGKVSEKEPSIQQDEEVNIVQGLNDFVNLNILSNEFTGQNRSPSLIATFDMQSNRSRSPSHASQRNNLPSNNNVQDPNNEIGIDLNNALQQNQVNNPENANNNQPQNMVNTISRGINQKMKEHLIFYVTLIILYMLACLTFERLLSFHVGVVFVVAILVLEFIKEIKRKLPNSYTLRQRRTRHIALLELVCLGFYVFGAALCLEGVDVKLYGFTIPGFLNIVCFFFATDSIGTSSIFGPKSKTILRRLYLWIQLLLVGIKGDGQMSSWQAALSLSYYLLFGFLFYAVLVFIIFLSAMFGWRRQESPYKINLIGFGWYFLVALYSWFWFSVLTGIIDVLDNHTGPNSLTSNLIGAIAHSVFLVLFVIVFRSQLSQFMRHEINEMGSRRNSAQQNRVEQVIKFQVSEEEIPYLVIISPTFYAHIKDAFKVNKNSLLQWINDIKIEKSKLRTMNKMNQERMNGSKYNTDKLFEPIQLDMSINVRNPASERQKEQVHPFSMMTVRNQYESLHLNNSKVFYSLNDISIYANIKKPFEQVQGASAENEQDKMCYICIEKPQNAVFLKCGHGGVCYDCALESWKKTDKCLICRQIVEKIVKIDTIDSLKVSKVIHSTRKIVEDKVLGGR